MIYLIYDLERENFLQLLKKLKRNTMAAKENLHDSLKKIQGIISWFEEQEEVDVEKGLEKVKEGAALIKSSRKRLQEIENEFEIVKKDLESE